MDLTRAWERFFAFFGAMCGKRISGEWGVGLMLLMALAMLPSCSTRLSVQKRHFRPGYHVEISAPTLKSSTGQGQTINHRGVISSGYTVSDARIADNSQQQLSGIVESLESSAPHVTMDAVAFLDKAVSQVAEESFVPNSQGPTRSYDRPNVLPTDSQWTGKSKSTKTVSVLPPPEHRNNQGLKVVGIVLASIGFLLFLFVSWLIGLIIMLLGLGLLLAGLSRSSKDAGSSSQRDTDTSWQDVVYLKNGSVIKGLIIEQVPNELLKIQTADGSVFVYKMGEVAKIAKEPK